MKSKRDVTHHTHSLMPHNKMFQFFYSANFFCSYVDMFWCMCVSLLITSTKWIFVHFHFHNDLISEITHLITRQNKSDVEKSSGSARHISSCMHTFTAKRHESCADNVRHLYNNFMLIYAGCIIAITTTATDTTVVAAANMTNIVPMGINVSAVWTLSWFYRF